VLLESKFQNTAWQGKRTVHIICMEPTP
jgi:hypothetical protein